MKKYLVKITADGVMEILANDREEAERLAIEEIAEIMVEYNAEILKIDGEEEE